VFDNGEVVVDDDDDDDDVTAVAVVVVRGSGRRRRRPKTSTPQGQSAGGRTVRSYHRSRHPPRGRTRSLRRRIRTPTAERRRRDDG